MQGRIFNFGGRRDGRIDISIDVICIVNYTRIHYDLLKVNHVLGVWCPLYKNIM